MTVTVTQTYQTVEVAGGPTITATVPQSVTVQDGTFSGYWLNVKDFGAVGDGVTNDSSAIQAALNAAAAAGQPGVVFLPGGKYIVQTTITLKQGVELLGTGSHDTATQPGSELRGGGSLTGPILYYPSSGANLWHHAGIRRLRCRGANTHGIHIEGGMGEASVIDQVMCNANGSDGIRIEGSSTPSILGHISVHVNGGSGVYLKTQTETHTQIGYLAGDENATALLYVDGLDTTSSVRVLGWKAERQTNSGHPDVFRINNGNGGYVDLGVGRVNIASAVTTAGTSIIRQTADVGAQVGRVSWYFGVKANGTSYTNGYQDDFNSRTITQANSIRKPLMMTSSGAGYIGVHVPPSVTGSRSGGAALTNLLSTLASQGVIVDGTTA